MRVISVAALAFCLLISGDLCDAQKCVDEKGTEVDWYVLYKLPKESAKKTDPKFLKEGLGYVYFSSRSAKLGWQLSELSIADPDSPPGRTLAPLYKSSGNDDAAVEGDDSSFSSSEQMLSIFYNDEHPEGNTSFVDGHTKGVVAFGSKGLGFWLVHSVPKFPPNPSAGGEYGYPHTGQMYGQTFLCISLNSKTE